MRSIVDRWSVSPTALARHKSEHLTVPAATGSPSEPDNLLDRLKALNSATAAILKDARAGGAKNNDLALKAIAHVEKQIEMERGWLAAAAEKSAVNLSSAPEWQQLRAVILTALEPFPEARLALAQAVKHVGA
jgi:hypothetical protein